MYGLFKNRTLENQDNDKQGKKGNWLMWRLFAVARENSRHLATPLAADWFNFPAKYWLFSQAIFTRDTLFSQLGRIGALEVWIDSPSFEKDSRNAVLKVWYFKVAIRIFCITFDYQIVFSLFQRQENWVNKFRAWIRISHFISKQFFLSSIVTFYISSFLSHRDDKTSKMLCC